MQEQLTDFNFLLFAAKHYENPQCYDTVEFYEDLNRIKYVIRLFKKYQKDSNLQERLILNHIVILNNVFGPSNVTRMLFLKVPPSMHSYLKEFLLFLGTLPDTVENVGIDNKSILTAEIPSCEEISERLKKL